jgi:hypothetical protein
MNCQECYGYIDAYIDNELDIASTILVKQHLKSQIRFLEEFNLLFRFLDPKSSNDPAVDLSFPG